jgi:RloB-like protein
MPKPKPKPSKKLLPVLHIYCEGEKTEPIYLNKYIEKKHPGNRELKVFKVEKTKKNTPIQLVDVAVKAKNDGNCPDDDIFWVVYDREAEAEYSNELHKKAADKAKANGVQVALSNVCFELWLLLHFESVAAPYSSCDNLLKDSKLKAYLKNLGIDKYAKADKKIFDLISGNISTARDRTKAMNKATQALAATNHKEPHQLNPYCDVPKLLEAIDDFALSLMAKSK